MASLTGESVSKAQNVIHQSVSLDAFVITEKNGCRIMKLGPGMKANIERGQIKLFGLYTLCNQFPVVRVVKVKCCFIRRGDELRYACC